jgi:hypothetical protein
VHAASVEPSLGISGAASAISQRRDPLLVPNLPRSNFLECAVDPIRSLGKGNFPGFAPFIEQPAVRAGFIARRKRP